MQSDIVQEDFHAGFGKGSLRHNVTFSGISYQKAAKNAVLGSKIATTSGFTRL